MTRPTISLWSTRCPAPARPRLSTIATDVARTHGLTLDDLRGPSRMLRHTRPRQEAMYLARQETRLSTTQIGRFFGGRDHTTVIYSVRVHAQRLAEANQ